MEMVCSELSARRPIYYIGADKEYAGHAFVLDGYDRNGMVHVDWGWGGTSNGYFDIATLQPYELGVGSGSGTGYAFAQLMSVGLVPATVDSEPKSLLGGVEEFIVEGDSAFIGFVMNQGGTFNGNMAIIAERDGVQTVMSELQPMEELYPFDILRGIRLELSYPSAAGTYRVYFGSRADGESSWTRARSNGFRTEEYVLTVHEDGTHEIVAAENRYPLPEVGQLSCDGNVYANCYAHINVPISNPLATDNLVGTLYFHLHAEDGQGYTLAASGVFLEPGQEGVQTVDVLMPDMEGACEISVYWITSDLEDTPIPVGQGFTAELRKGVVTDEVNLRSASLDRNVYMQGDTVTCTWQMDLEGLDADVFSQSLVVGVWPKEFGASLFVESVVATVEQGVPVEFSRQTVADLEPGEYRYMIISGNSALWTGYFTVAEAAGIVSARPDAEEAPEWCPSDGGTELRFRYAKEVERVAVYDVAGRLVRTAGAVRGGNGVYAVDGSGLPRGQYVMRIPATDGTVAVLKFLR